jgi:alkanesulfonate monooxygenase
VLTVYSTSPGYFAAPRHRVLETSRRVWASADVAGVRGALIFTDAHSFDPFVVAQRMLESTERLVPLVAVQPPFTHPYHVARQVSTLAYHYDRPVDINLVTGGDPTQLRVVGNDLDHDARYQRLVEFGQILERLTGGRSPTTFEGEHYCVREAFVQPVLPERLAPRTFLAGTSPACRSAAQALGATQLSYPRDVAHYDADPALAEILVGNGVRLGIIARDTSDAAWAEAERRFPASPRAEAVLLRSRMKRRESSWVRSLMGDVRAGGQPESPYWLRPFRSGREYCPFLVGSHAEVGDYLSGYLRLGVTTLILHALQEEDDVPNAKIAIEDAVRRTQAAIHGTVAVRSAGAGSPPQ